MGRQCWARDGGAFTQAFYNDKKPILSDGDFNELRENLAFSGSDVATMNRMEIMFMCAANRYAAVSG